MLLSRCLGQLQMAVALEQKEKNQREERQRNGGLPPPVRFPKWRDKIPIWKLPRGLLRKLCSISRETWNKPLENTLQPKKKWSGLACRVGIQVLDLLRCGALRTCLSLPVFVTRKMRVIMALFLRVGVRRINRKCRAQCPVHRVPKMLVIITMIITTLQRYLDQLPVSQNPFPR